MSDLTRFRDHARGMATATHRPDCPGLDARRPYLKPDPTVCAGCVTAADRALWSRLTTEADAYLTRNQDTPMEAPA